MCLTHVKYLYIFLDNIFCHVAFNICKFSLWLSRKVAYPCMARPLVCGIVGQTWVCYLWASFVILYRHFLCLRLHMFFLHFVLFSIRGDHYANWGPMCELFIDDIPFYIVKSYYFVVYKGTSIAKLLVPLNKVFGDFPIFSLSFSIPIHTVNFIRTCFALATVNMFLTLCFVLYQDRSLHNLRSNVWVGYWWSPLLHFHIVYQGISLAN
jgi:hypothetical protein